MSTLDIDTLEGDLKSNLGLEKFNELPITTNDINSSIDDSSKKSEAVIRYLNFIADNLFDELYQQLEDKKRNMILLVATPVMNAIIKGKITLDDIQCDPK